MIQFTKEDSKEFRAFRNGTADPRLVAIMDMQPAIRDGKWVVISEELNIIIFKPIEETEQSCWDYIRSVKIL